MTNKTFALSGLEPIQLDMQNGTNCVKSKKRRCGTLTIFYGSGSDFWKVTVPVPTFDTLRFPVPDPYLVSRPLIADHK